MDNCVVCCYPFSSPHFLIFLSIYLSITNLSPHHLKYISPLSSRAEQSQVEPRRGWLIKREARREMASTTFGRGSQTMNSIFFKPMIRKAYHRKSSSPDSIWETMKMEAEEVKSSKSSHQQQQQEGELGCSSSSWVPHEKTGIYYPMGQEKVIEDVPSAAAKDMGVNWFYPQ